MIITWWRKWLLATSVQVWVSENPFSRDLSQPTCGDKNMVITQFRSYHGNPKPSFLGVLTCYNPYFGGGTPSFFPWVFGVQGYVFGTIFGHHISPVWLSNPNSLVKPHQGSEGWSRILSGSKHLYIQHTRWAPLLLLMEEILHHPGCKTL